MKSSVAKKLAIKGSLSSAPKVEPEKEKPFEFLGYYHEASRRLRSLLLSAQTVEDLLEAFRLEPVGSLHFCGIPLLSLVQLHQVASILALYLRVIDSNAGIYKASGLPITIKRAAWKLLTKAEKQAIRNLLAGMSRGAKS